MFRVTTLFRIRVKITKININSIHIYQRFVLKLSIGAKVLKIKEKARHTRKVDIQAKIRSIGRTINKQREGQKESMQYNT